MYACAADVGSGSPFNIFLPGAAGAELPGDQTGLRPPLHLENSSPDSKYAASQAQFRSWKQICSMAHADGDTLHARSLTVSLWSSLNRSCLMVLVAGCRSHRN
jgi:hypothetical protein